MMLAGMNSGVLLLRNTDWNRDLFAQMAAYGTTPMDIAKEEVSFIKIVFEREYFRLHMPGRHDSFTRSGCTTKHKG